MLFRFDDWPKKIDARVVWSAWRWDRKISQGGRAGARHGGDQLGKYQQIGAGFEIIQALDRQQIRSHMEKAGERRDVEIRRNHCNGVITICGSAIGPGGYRGIWRVAPGDFPAINIGDESVIETDAQSQALDH